MKAQAFELAGRTHYLLYNGTAMFEVKELLPPEQELFPALNEMSAAGYDRLCKVAVILAEQGELFRRYEGHDSGKLLSEDELKLLASPVDVMQLRAAVMRAVLAGHGREVDEKKTVNVELAEFEKKTGSHSRKRTT